MRRTVLDIFFKNMIAVIRSPAHTSDRLQPLDLSVFGPLKHFPNTAIEDVSRDHQKVLTNC